MKKKRWILITLSVLVPIFAAIGIRSTWVHKLEKGYVAFNAGEYKAARDELSFIARLGDTKAQQLLSYMSGLGLGQSVDFGEAMHWMRKSLALPGNKDSVGEQAYYLGVSAVDGLYGEEKKELGLIWLKISYFSGEQKAGVKLNEINKQ